MQIKEKVSSKKRYKEKIRLKEDVLTYRNKLIKTEIKLNNGDAIYSYLSTHKNDKYEDGIRMLPFESCLIHNNSSKNRYDFGGFLRVQTEPKWITSLAKMTKDDEGEYNHEILVTNNFKSSNYRKIKALDKFCLKYQPLYQQRKVTMFFLTFTQANKARLSWVTMMQIIKDRFKELNYPVLDYVWTSEVSENLHFHYHLAVAVNRINIKKIPQKLKFEKIWGMRTEIDFVKKNIRHYMAKYFAKSNYRIEGLRSYGISKIKN